MKIIRIFLASPSDVEEERNIVVRVVEEINKTVYRRESIRLELLKWETHVSPTMGRPQQSILDQIGPHYDIFLGIMWKRFGTPTGNANSGTQEEFDKAYEQWRQYGHPRIMFYFNQTPYILKNTDELDQLRMVLEFRKELEKVGLIWTYESREEFERIVRSHLMDATHYLFEVDTKPKNVFIVGFDISAPNTIAQPIKKLRIIEMILNHLSIHLSIPTEGLIEKFSHREELGTTSPGGFFAVPHIYNTELNQYFVAVIRSNIDIDWESYDNTPARLIFLGLFPHRQNDMTLRILANASRQIKESIDRNTGNLLKPVHEITCEMAKALSATVGATNEVNFKKFPDLTIDNV